MSRPRPAWRPPPRDGVGPSAVALPAGPWPTVLAFLCARLPQVGADEWQARMARGNVLDPTGHPLPPDAAYRPLQRVWYWRTPPAEPVIPFKADLIFRDDTLLVVDKPHFLPMTPTGRYARETLLARLQRELGLDSLVPIHRLDRDTAGVVVFCLQPQHRAAYQALFRERLVHKVYEAVAPWRADLALPQVRRSHLRTSAAHFMQMEEAEGLPNAETRIELMAHGAEHALYRLTPLTGRTHQLRVHMNALGLPLLGDRIYPVLQPELPPGQMPDCSQPLQLLARALSFTDPVTHQPRRFESRRSLAFFGAAY